MYEQFLTPADVEDKTITIQTVERNSCTTSV